MSPADGMVPGKGFEGGWLAEGLADDATLECGVCWRVYDPAVGDRARAIDGLRRSGRQRAVEALDLDAIDGDNAPVDDALERRELHSELVRAIDALEEP